MIKKYINTGTDLGTYIRKNQLANWQILQGHEAKRNLARSSILSIFPSPVYIYAALQENWATQEKKKKYQPVWMNLSRFLLQEHLSALL